jgi:hypothetical protein
MNTSEAEGIKNQILKMTLSSSNKIELKYLEKTKSIFNFFRAE